MGVFEVLRAIIFVFPFGIFLSIGLFALVTISMKVLLIDQVFRRIILFYSFSGCIAGLLWLSFWFFPNYFHRFDVLYCLSVMINIQTVMYFLLFSIRKTFSFLHYTGSVFLCFCLLVLKLLLPDIWTNEGTLFCFVIVLLFCIVYSLLELYVINNHYKTLVRTGCQWRILPKDYLKWELVYYYFRKWSDLAEFNLLLSHVRESIRFELNRNKSASLGIIDSQSVKWGNNKILEWY